MKRELNLKFLGWLLGALLLGGVGVHALHEFQNRRHAGAWLQQAKQAERRGETWRRLNYLSRYLAYQPADYDVLADYGLLLDQEAASPQAREHAFVLLQRALTQNPDRHDVRVRIVHRAMQRGCFTEAGDHLQILLQSSPRNGEYALLLGQCLEGTGDYEQAATWYEKAIHDRPTELGSYVRLAGLLQNRLEDPGQARQVLERMVTANEHSFQALLIRARFRKEAGMIPQAVDDVKRAWQLAPTEPDVLCFAAALAPVAGLGEETRARLRAGLTVHPRHAALYRALAELELQATRPQEAIACLRRGLVEMPEQLTLLQSLCDLLIQRGQLDEARLLIARLRQRDCLAARAGYWDARVLIQQRQWQEAVRLLEKAASELTTSPEWTTPVHIALGYCFDQLGDQHRQLDAYRRAVAGDASSATARKGLADALLELGEVNEAMAEYRQVVLRVEPAAADRLAQLLYDRRRFAEADYVLRLCQEQRPFQGLRARLAAEVALANSNHPRAVELARRAVVAGAADFRAQLWLGHILEAAGQLEEAEKTLRDAVEQSGTIPDTWIALVQHLGRTGKQEEAEALIQPMENHLPPDQLPLTRACCYQALAQFERAEEQYQAALADRPDDCTVLQKVADYYLTTAQTDKAQRYLRRLMDLSLSAPDDQVAWARRQLALLLAGNGAATSIGEALALLEQNRRNGGDRVEDQRVRARVLASQPDHQAEALRLLVASAAARSYTPDEEYLLARLYQTTGEPLKAREHLLNLLAAQGQNPLYLAAYIRSLLHTGEVSEAQRWFAKLERLAPQTNATQEVRVELMKAPRAQPQ